MRSVIMDFPSAIFHTFLVAVLPPYSARVEAIQHAVAQPAENGN